MKGAHRSQMQTLTRRPQAIIWPQVRRHDFDDRDLLVDERRVDLRRFGTFAPSLRASESPIAIACFRLVTFFPDLPLLSSPRFISCIARSTFVDAFLLYRRAMLYSLSDPKRSMWDATRRARVLRGTDSKKSVSIWLPSSRFARLHRPPAVDAAGNTSSSEIEVSFLFAAPSSSSVLCKIFATLS